MKQFCRVLNFRKAKNDNIDATQIAEYGLMYWKELQEHKVDTENFRTLKRIKQILSALHGPKNQSNELHRPNNQSNISGNKKLIFHGSKDFSKDKLLDFLETWWHKDLVLEKQKKNS